MTKKIILVPVLFTLFLSSQVYAESTSTNLKITQETKTSAPTNQLITREKPINTSHNMKPELAGLLNILFPGFGYYYIGEPIKGITYNLLQLAMAPSYYITTSDPNEKRLKENISRITFNLDLYSVYDAYTTAMITENKVNKTLNIKKYTFSELFLSPFDERTYKSKDKDVSLAMMLLYGILPIRSAILVAMNGGISPNLKWQNAAISIPLILLQSMLVGIGEETFFRGYLQPTFSEMTQSKLWGNIIQASYFGLCHTRFGKQYHLTSIPIISKNIFQLTANIDTTREYYNDPGPFSGENTSDLVYFSETAVLGFAFGWINEHADGLLNTVVLHSLTDASLLIAQYLMTGQTGRAYFEFEFPF